MRPWTLAVNDLFPLGDAYGTRTEAPRPIDKAVHEDAVGGEEVFGGRRVPSFHGLVGIEGVFHLLDFAGRAEHAFPGDDGGDLLQGEGVVLDGEGGMDGSDPVFPTQHGSFSQAGGSIQPTQQARDLRDRREGG
jgi:hypothetical protein